MKPRHPAPGLRGSAAPADEPPKSPRRPPATAGAPASRALSDAQPEGPVTRHPVVLALTGASGAPYGVRLLDVLARHQVPVWLIASSHGMRLLRDECGIDSPGRAARGHGRRLALGHALSGRRPRRAAGVGLAADARDGDLPVLHGHRRGHRRRAPAARWSSAPPTSPSRSGGSSILVPRETPLSLVHLRNLVTVTEAGAVVIPAAPGFYHRPTTVAELVDFIVQRVLDQLGPRHRDRPALDGRRRLMARIGVIADTHGLLRPEVFEVFREVDHILHAGDVGAGIDSRGARGHRAGHGGLRQYRRLGGPGPASRRSPPSSSTASPSSSPTATSSARPTPEQLQAAFPDAEIIVYGHTHRPLLTLVDVVVTVMNPGGAGPRRFDLPASVGILELEPGIPPRGRLVPLTPLDHGLAAARLRRLAAAPAPGPALGPAAIRHAPAPRHRAASGGGRAHRQRRLGSRRSCASPRRRARPRSGCFGPRTRRSWRSPCRTARAPGADARGGLLRYRGRSGGGPGARRLPVVAAAGARQQRGLSRPGRTVGAAARRSGLAARCRRAREVAGR